MVLIIGHRGAMGLEPENTPRSFRKAVELGAGMVEFDVRVCGSGDVVVMHDSTVDRTTDGSGRVSEKTLGELRCLDAGRGERIPTLREALDLMRGRAGVNVELKDDGSSAPVQEIVAGCVREGVWSYDDIIVSSFNHSELENLRLLDGKIRTGVLFEEAGPFVEVALELDAHSLNLRSDLVSGKVIDEAHGNGLKVFAWVVNEPSVFERMLSLGVDGVFTDFPGRFSCRGRVLHVSRSHRISCRARGARPSGQACRAPEGASLS